VTPCDLRDGAASETYGARDITREFRRGAFFAWIRTEQTLPTKLPFRLVHHEFWAERGLRDEESEPDPAKLVSSLLFTKMTEKLRQPN
jgi:hypothetical protein